MKWIIGANLFSSWRGETETDWQANAAFLADFSLVEPYHTPEDRRETFASRGMHCLQTDDEGAAHDKKRRFGQLSFVLLEDIGSPLTVDGIDEGQIIDALERLKGRFA